MRKASTIIRIAMGAALAVGLTAAAPAPTKSLAKAPAAVAVSLVQSGDGYNRRVRIHNQTGWTMLRFYASDSRVSEWQEDMLGSRVMASGSSWVMNIDDGSGACVYDFKAEFQNGEVLTRMRINVCQISDYYYTR